MKKLQYIFGILLVCSVSHAGLITHTDYTSGNTITASLQNSNENAIVNEINGNIDSTNIENGSIEIADLSSAIQANFLPVGLISPYGGTSAPTGWLLCNGQAISRTTYAALFAIVSTSFGSGNGSTTFNIPDFSSRTVMGATTGGTYSTIGTSTGSLALDVSGTTGSNGAHTHVLTTTADVTSNYAALTSIGTTADNLALKNVDIGGGTTVHIKSATTDSQGTHTHTFVNTTTNLQPSLIVNFIIKY